jgi:chemotaxis protein methyltransferase CheR
MTANSGNALAHDARAAGVVQTVREFAFSEDDFRELARLAYRHAGIVLQDNKRNLVYGRLSRRVRALGLATFREYRDYLAADERELERFINSLSTNHTKFFREAHHFEHLREQVAAPFAKAVTGTSGRRLRVWSAGCSTGEEAYSIALVLMCGIKDIARHDVRILATDIDTAVLAKAARGIFASSGLDDVPEPYRASFRLRTNAAGAEQARPDFAARKLIAFRQLNLLGQWPFRGLFDAIFCRNVMIYFDAAAQAELIERFTQQIRPGGWLYIGHSESLLGSHAGLKLSGRTAYQRVR